jgi:hypothetical protein
MMHLGPTIKPRTANKRQELPRWRRPIVAPHFLASRRATRRDGWGQTTLDKRQRPRDCRCARRPLAAEVLPHPTAASLHSREGPRSEGLLISGDVGPHRVNCCTTASRVYASTSLLPSHLITKASETERSITPVRVPSCTRSPTFKLLASVIVLPPLVQVSPWLLSPLPPGTERDRSAFSNRIASSNR